MGGDFNLIKSLEEKRKSVKWLELDANIFKEIYDTVADL